MTTYFWTIGQTIKKLFIIKVLDFSAKVFFLAKCKIVLELMQQKLMLSFLVYKLISIQNQFLTVFKGRTLIIF